MNRDMQSDGTEELLLISGDRSCTVIFLLT